MPTPAKPRPADALSVPNAGLVLLTPFLRPLFQRADFLETDAFRSPAAAQRAALLLHYLASGETRATAPALTLPKILSGLAPADSVALSLELTATEIDLTASLLHAVITRWTQLGQISNAALQGTFLQRPGTLAKTPPGWTLNVEHRAVDVLVKTCPWSFSSVKLPWMPAPMLVDWN